MVWAILLTIVERRLYDLKGAGFDPRDLKFPYFENNPQCYWESGFKEVQYFTIDKSLSLDEAYEVLSGFYVDRIKMQMETMKDFSKTLGKVEQMSPMSFNEWINALEGEKPLEWALRSGKSFSAEEGFSSSAGDLEGLSHVKKLDKQREIQKSQKGSVEI